MTLLDTYKGNEMAVVLIGILLPKSVVRYPWQIWGQTADIRAKNPMLWHVQQQEVLRRSSFSWTMKGLWENKRPANTWSGVNCYASDQVCWGLYSQSNWGGCENLTLHYTCVLWLWRRPKTMFLKELQVYRVQGITFKRLFDPYKIKACPHLWHKVEPVFKMLSGCVLSVILFVVFIERTSKICLSSEHIWSNLIFLKSSSD